MTISLFRFFTSFRITKQFHFDWISPTPSLPKALFDELNMLSPILRRRLAQVPLDVTAEIGRRGEVEHLGNIHETEAPVPQLAGNIQDREAVYPPVGRIVGNGLADL